MCIFVVDNHPLMREAIGMLIRRLSPSTPVIEIDRIALVAAAVEQHGTPNLICLDLKLPDTHGVSGIRELKLRYPDVSMVVLTALSAADYEDLAIEAGADAFVEKSASATEIGNVLREFLSKDLGTEAPVTVGKLSKRQKQLLVLLDKGQSNRDIAETLQISEHTVKVHLWRLFRRLSVKSRSQASHLARTQGLL
ncbi:MAG: response regulator transcription factor [Polaromonas sp.]|nr:response regulator transcription factor [Polaromonas sp.]